ncbi:hypothetical protein DDB_G0270912 [Dictyostelium discoideum AX4]|uniref:Uncharacterized protein n=1 Tax=Dictyostelium discoideum TaxID=44689 RepID=Q55DF2_DICDI|nr:hypothetical protein DDB_G0270912 [Dictyostelium discoideum AX4]EAL72806.1 hypothetical protein DDB_G0270912 [Dictyostelium discoideum AX4]|eukprot:XP_646179.1 hypothetical protein DDB_G0270912 [Dictyostelium discoideum AX4]
MAIFASLKSIYNFNKSNIDNKNIFNSNSFNSNNGINKISRLPPGYFDSTSFPTKGYVLQYPDGIPTTC